MIDYASKNHSLVFILLLSFSNEWQLEPGSLSGSVFRPTVMAETFASTVSPPTVELGLAAVPNTQLLATASVSNYASERKYAQQHPTWHKPQIMHCPNPSGLPETRGVQVRTIGAYFGV